MIHKPVISVQCEKGTVSLDAKERHDLIYFLKNYSGYPVENTLKGSRETTIQPENFGGLVTKWQQWR